MKIRKNNVTYTGSGFILAQDCALSLLASLLSILLARGLSAPIPGFSKQVFLWLGVALAATFAGLLLAGCHKVVRRYFTLRQTSRFVTAVLLKEAALALILALGLVRLPSLTLCVLAILADILFTGVFLVYSRLAARFFSSAPKEERPVAVAARKNALVMGDGESSVRLAADLEKDGGYNVAGFVSLDPAMEGRVVDDRVVFHLGSADDLDRLQWKVGGIDGIFFPRDLAVRKEEVLSGAAAAEEPVRHADGMSVVGLALKRAFDLALSGVLIVVFSPLFLICAIAVKLEDGGPVIYAQERIGRGGKPFHIYKLRSMRTDAEAGGNPALYGGDDDPRLTRVGRFLRAHHLDELPQLFNVFRGDMSFIGHRPERQYYIDKIMACDSRYRYLYQIRPGVTSYATLYNGYTDTMDKMLTRLDLDLYYLRNRSLWFDVRVLGLTFLSIVTGKRF